MIPQAEIAHRIPGRVRLSIPAKRGDDAYFAGLAEQLARRPGVVRVKPNARAASIVLEHSGDAAPILAWTAEARVLELPDPNQRAASGERPGLLAAADPTIRLVSGREINYMFMAGVAYLGIGLIQLARGRVMVPAATALWYAISVFPQWHSLAAAVPARAGDE